MEVYYLKAGILPFANAGEGREALDRGGEDAKGEGKLSVKEPRGRSPIEA